MYQRPQRGPTGLGVTDRSPRPVHLLHHHPGGASLALLGRIHGKTAQQGVARMPPAIYRTTGVRPRTVQSLKHHTVYISVLQIMVAGFTGVFVRPSRSAAVVSASIIRHARFSVLQLPTG